MQMQAAVKEISAMPEQKDLGNCMDGFNKGFTDEEEMMQFLSESDEKSIWTKVPANQLRIITTGRQPLFAYGIKQKYGLDSPVEIVQDTMTSTGLLLSCGESKKCIRDTAIKTLLERARISGPALSALNDADFAEVLNKCLAVAKGQALLLDRGQKITAMNAGDENDYKVLKISELMRTLFNVLETRMPGYCFMDGYTDYAITTARITFPFQATQLMKKYRKTCEEHGIHIDSKITPAIRFQTSDIGTNGANINAYLHCSDGKTVCCGNSLKMAHKGKASIDAFAENVNLSFAKFEDMTKELERLCDIRLRHPVNAMIAVMKRLGLPKKLSMESISRFEAVIGEGISSAHDVYWAMNDILLSLKSSKDNDKTNMLNVEESLARALHLNWLEYDYAIRPTW